MTTVVLLGTLDTKGEEYEYVRSCLSGAGLETLVVDAGVYEPQGSQPEVSRQQVAESGGSDIDSLAEAGDRAAAVEAMSRGAAVILQNLYESGSLAGVLAMGGSGGTSLAAQAMRALPVGVPKLIVSTVASGDTRPYVGHTDITMMPSVTDIAGLNSFTKQVLTNAAAAVGGMALSEPPTDARDRPIIGATMFGVTTPAVTHARELLEAAGYEVLVFHATGVGGQALEALVNDGYLSGVLDMTTTELCDDLVGGVMSAGPTRLEAAGAAGIPQVVSLGALEMVNWGPLESVPSSFAERNLLQHNAAVTLMRTTKHEASALGSTLATKLNRATGPTAVFIPRGGFSSLSTTGQPFRDSQLDDALIEALTANLEDHVEVIESHLDINDPVFSAEMVAKLISFLNSDGETI